MAWTVSRTSCSPSREARGPIWSSQVNVINPVVMMGGWHHSPILPLPVQMMARPGSVMSARPLSVMTGSLIEDFVSTVPTLNVSQFEDFVTATPTSAYRDIESSATVRNENEYENEFYDDLTELRTEFDVTEILFESSSSFSSASSDSSEGYPALFLQVISLRWIALALLRSALLCQKFHLFFSFSDIFFMFRTPRLRARLK